MGVFLDYAATSPIRASALAALNQALSEIGNPSSVHTHGQHTREILESARDQLAKAVNCNRAEIIFTSGGTESNNMAIKGMWWRRKEQNPERNIVISAATEHHALIDPIEWLVTQEGAELLEVPVSKTGEFELAALDSMLDQNSDRVALISLMWVNNETSVIADIQAITKLAAKYGIPVHSDAVAALGHVPIDFAASGLTAMSISGHKVGAPIGVGALVVSRGFNPVSLLHGGGQERGLRSGTMNFPLAASFASAASEAVSELTERQSRLRPWRDRIEAEVTAAHPEVFVTAEGANRAEHNAHMVFPGASSDNLLFLLDQRGISISAGSACQAGVLGPSHVLLGMGLDEKLASSCLRITLGHDTVEADIDAVISALIEVYPLAKAATPQ